MLERIVVGVDGRDGGRDALALASLLQRAGGGELIAVNVYRYERSVSVDDARRLEAALHDDLLAVLREELAAAQVAARPVVVSNSIPQRAIVAVADAERADLIVLGSPHRAGVDRLVAGDVTAATLHHARCPVAVAPSGFVRTTPVLRRIGVGFDDSEEARAARRLAKGLAAPSRAHVDVMVVMAPDDPADELAARGADLDLLLVGSRGLGPLRRLLLGSTSAKLVRAPSCPVIVVGPGAVASAVASFARANTG